MSVSNPLELKIMRTDTNEDYDAEVRVNAVLHITLQHRQSVNIAIDPDDDVDVTMVHVPAS